MFSYSIRFLALSVVFFLSACVLPFDNARTSKILLPATVPVDQVNKKLPAVSSQSSLVNAIYINPEVARSLAAINAANSKVLILNAKKVSKIDLSGSTGFTSQNDFNTKVGAVATVKVSRVLFENGQVDRSILIGDLNAQSVSQEALIVFDKTLQKILKAQIEKNASRKIVKVIDHYLNLYNQRENLVRSAVQAGVLSKSDYLEIRSVKNNTLSERIQATQRMNKASSFLKQKLGSDSVVALADLEKRYNSQIEPKIFIETSPQKNLIDLKISRLNIEIEIQKNRSKPISQWETSVSSPTANSTDSTIFAGITISLPLKDGGDAAARIDVFSEELVVARLNLEILADQVSLTEKNWIIFQTYYKNQKKLLLERKSISTERVADLELRLKAGKTNIKELTKEILVSAKTEIELVQLDAEQASKRIETTAVTSQSCGLLLICELIKKTFTN